MLRKAIFFIIGAALGSIVTFFVTKNVVTAREKQLSDEKLASMEEYVAKIREKAAKKDYEGAFVSNAKEDEAPEPLEYKDYTSMYKSNSNEEWDAEEAMAEATHPTEDLCTESERMTMERASHIPPKLVTAEEYDSPEYDHHDKVSLLYFVDDDTLVDENDEIVTDEAALLGDCLTKYNFKGSDERVVYVRNVSRGSDYEVEKVFGAYSDRY